MKFVLNLTLIAFAAVGFAAESRIYLGSCPSVSPDGHSFVFEWNDSLWSASTSGGRAVRITPEESKEAFPVMSPDGRRVAFLSNRDGAWKIFAMELSTGDVRQISHHSEYTQICGWSADGKTLVGTSIRDHAASDVAQRVTFYDMNGRESYPLDRVVATGAVLSPDGHTLAFTRRGENLYRKRRCGKSPTDAEIWLYDLVSRKFAKPATLSESAHSPVWRPDGKAFYYLGRKPGDVVAAVREYSLSGEDREVVSFGEDAAFQPTVSSDGHTMLVRACFDFWRLDPTESRPTPERIALRADGFQPRGNGTRRRFYEKAWNNDYGGDISFCSAGKEVAFTAGGGLYAMDLKIRSPRLVADVPRARIAECMFNTEGSGLYYLVDYGDRTDLCVARRTDTALPWWENSKFELKTLHSTWEVLFNFSVSPDGGRLAWDDNLGTMTFADAQGNVTGRSPESGGCGTYAWSPDGRYVAASLLDANNNSDVWILDIDGEHAPCNLSRNWDWDGHPAWSPDGKIIAWSGKRPGSAVNEIFYVYVDPEDEANDKRDFVESSRRELGLGKKSDGGSQPSAETVTKIVFDGIEDRIRSTRIAGVMPFFSHDSRTLAYDSGSGTDTIHLPDRMKPVRLTDKRGQCAQWYAQDDCLAWNVDGHPAHKSTIYDFKVFREDDMADYRELVFRTAWARIRDRFYDRNYHGAQWNAVREKYLPAAREASSYSVFTRVMDMMLGELDASHLGFYPSQSAEREWVRSPALHNWTLYTGHLGVKFKPGTSEISEVIPDSPADGVLAAGDVIVAIDGRRLTDDSPVAEFLNTPEYRQVQILLKGREDEPLYIKPASYAAIRDLIKKDNVKAVRRSVHGASGGRIGYLAVPQMNIDSYSKFEGEVFSEGWDKDALVIDLRGNLGGFTGDRLLAVLCGGDHSRSVTPNGMTGYIFEYWTHPVFSKPIAVIVDERVQSNGEIFTHAIKSMKRGVVVGRRTSGSVIATLDRPLLDYGMFRDAFWGWFLLDGSDMENNGVVPDIPVDITPEDEYAGRDPQLDAAVSALLREIASPKKQFSPRYAK